MKFTWVPSCSCLKAAVSFLGMQGLVPTLPPLTKSDMVPTYSHMKSLSAPPITS